MGDDEKQFGPRPAVPMPGDDEDELVRRCHDERDQLTPHETADCAGAALTELYENEEDGGS